jgi:hypothetical protein
VRFASCRVSPNHPPSRECTGAATPHGARASGALSALGVSACRHRRFYFPKLISEIKFATASDFLSETTGNTAALAYSLLWQHIRWMQPVRKPIARTSKANRSAVTNGSKLLVGIDMRSPTARRYRDLVHAYKAEIGGDLSEPEMSLIKTAAGLSLTAELMQADIVNGKPSNTDDLIRLSSEVRRILDSLTAKAGKRKPEAPTLAAYLAGKQAAAETDG